MKHILWIVAVAFVATIVFSWGMGGFKNKSSAIESGVIGVINGQKIQYQQFYTAYMQELEAAKEQAGDQEITEFQQRSIREQVWQGFIRDVLFAREIDRQGIRVSAEEIVFHLRNNPPDFIINNEQFQTDGQFDIAKYHQALGDPRNYEAWIPIENYLKSIIPVQKLQQQIIATIRVTPEEAIEALRLENEKVNARYLFFDPNQISSDQITISDAEVKTYYDQHKNEYTEPEKRQIQYILFESKPSKEDSLEIRQDAQDIVQQIRDGADFDEMARSYSEDEGTASKGGDLGFFGKGAMVKPFEEAAFNARLQEVVGPVESQFGLHIIQVLARKVEDGENKVHARHILLKFKTSPETTDALGDKAQFMYEEIVEGKQDFAVVAQNEGYTIQETLAFQQGDFVPGIGMSSRINRLAFDQKVGWVSQPITSGENIILFRVSAAEKARTKTVDEVESLIRGTLERKKKKAVAGQNCQQAHLAIASGMSLEEVAARDSMEVFETGLIAAQSYISRVGRDASFSGAAFHLNVGDVSEPVEGIRGYYLIRTIDRVPFDASAFEDQIETKRQQLLQQKQQTVYTAWFNALKDQAKIEDNRDYYFN